MATLAERLAEALQERGYSDRGAARELRRRGASITHAYIGQLRKGDKTNPSLEHLQALADLLGTSIDWLTGRDPVPETEDDEGERQQREDVRRGLEELGVTNIAQRMNGLSPLSLSAVAQMVEAMRAAESLDEEDDFENL
ncbi:hypothetical protein GCM10010412_081930 [Nonomuraea recticatena]|uniref:HTH cro/C1-type domain-containing protein n=1 Tax=Nonomuraea recticatena TaxID=46178 RepID=A0ABP6FGL6_9ACTN